MTDTPSSYSGTASGIEPQILPCPDGATIAYHRTAGKGPGIVFLGGFRSDMTGTKAQALEAHCKARNRAFLRFDYFGHGASSGDFTDGTIGRWADDAIRVLDELTEGSQILVGSSMGGWIMLLAALAKPDRIGALIGIAAAPDFTETLMWNRFADAVKDTLRRDGVFYQPSEYDDGPYPITMSLIEEARGHLLLEQTIDVTCPVHLIQGMKDDAVPWQHALAISENLASEQVTVTLIKDGDHRLSRDEDLERLMQTVESLAGG